MYTQYVYVPATWTSTPSAPVCAV